MFPCAFQQAYDRLHRVSNKLHHRNPALKWRVRVAQSFIVMFIALWITVSPIALQVVDAIYQLLPGIGLEQIQQNQGYRYNLLSG